MTPDELELRKFEIEAETKRSEIRASIWKITLGTGVIGLAAAFFPFAQQYATEYFAVQIETMKQKAANEIQAKESDLKNTTLNRDFLASIGQEGRSKNLNDRIVLAEYYTYLSDNNSEQERWKKFLEHLYELRKEEREAAINAVRIASTKESSVAEIAVANTTARLLRESSLVGERDSNQIPDTQEQKIHSLLEALSSSDTAKRRNARSLLADRGIEIVRPAMIKFSITDIDYRTKLGLLVALAEMMRDNKDHRQKIIDLLQPRDLENLLYSATDSDRTIRVYASEFLYDLGDPRLFNLSISLWSETNNTNGKYNLALIMKGSAPFVEQKKVSEVVKKLNALKGTVGSKTDSLLDDAIRLLQR